MKFWSKSLRGRLILLLLAALVLAQAVAFLLHLSDRHDYIREINEAITTRRIPAAVELLSAVPASRRPPLAEALSTTWSRLFIAAQPAVGEEGGFTEQARQLAGSLGQADEAVRMGQRTSPSGTAPLPRWSGETFAVAVRLGAEQWLVVERPLRPALHHAIGPVVLSLTLSALAVLAAVAWLARRITRPLSALTEAADRFGRGDSVAPLTESGPEDLRRTIRAFNAMSGRLQRFIDDRTRMLAAISHDLRTPITALRLRSEMVDDTRTRERMQRSLDEMQRMVEATLQFARAEAVQEAAEPLDLGALVAEVCADVADAGGSVQWEVAGEVPVLARRVGLARALRNLVDNAVFYGHKAQVTARVTAEGALVQVDDAGPGIPPAERERVFEPFVRLEGSRSMETGGIGLGLATARTTIHAHGGTIRLGESPRGGLRAEVVLPLR